MTFIWPVMLMWLMLIPLFAAVYVALVQRRRRLAATFSNMGLVPSAGSDRLRARRHIPAVFFLVALAILIVALARPQAVVALPRLEGTVILAFDVSASMGGDDIKPTRLEAAKAAAVRFVQNQPSNVQMRV